MRREERLAEVRELLGEGLTHHQIAERLGVSVGAVRNVLYDPDGSKQRTRRGRYQGVCIDCGTTTDGSSGYAAPELCNVCAPARRRIWTRESVIDAVRRFAEEHGRPPAASDWDRSDPKRGYPNRSNVYRSSTGSTNRSAPFATWGDAIEAAGFPRPLVGVYDRNAKVAA